MTAPFLQRRLMLGATAFAAALAGSLVGCKPRTAERMDPVRVAAASDLTLPFEEIARSFENDARKDVSLTFGSTGILAKQIAGGAPFDLFAAANTASIEDVIAKGTCDASTKRPYGRGRLVVWKRQGAPLLSIADLANAEFARIAIANPEHAPYGQAARQALQRAGVWSSVETRIVHGESVRQALQFAESGNADAAIIALSLVSNDTAHPWTLVEESLHAPIVQTLVVCNGGKDKAGGSAFADFIGTPVAQRAMKRFGFSAP